MKKILFVEDDALMRDVYRALLDGEPWEVTTASDGAEALTLMAQRSFDVVASDMRMEGMNGIELLNEVIRLYPQTSRIIISGIADQSEAADALGATHQFLVKPVGFDALLAVLARIGHLDTFLKGEKLKTLAGRMRVLPSFPVLYLKIMKAIEEPDTSMQEIRGVIIEDPGLTAKILQVVNSAAMGLTNKVSDPLEAVQHLGLGTVRSLALSAHVFASYTASQKINFPVNALWAHLMTCATTARAIMVMEDADHVSAEAAYTAGMLHDIGKLMLADSLPDEFQNMLATAATRNAPFHTIEQETLGATHAGLAAYLLGLWGLPAPIVEAVAFHHTPENSSVLAFGPLTAVHVANALEHEKDGDHPDLNKDYLAKIGMAKRLDVWREEVQKLREEG
jgi:HD-like signal output (HDOD) protein